MKASKVYNVNLKITVATSQLRWTTHGKQRLAERGVELPSHITRWDMIDYCWDEKGDYPRMVLRHQQRGRPDIILVVTKAKEPDKYVVITTYWDESKKAA